MRLDDLTVRFDPKPLPLLNCRPVPIPPTQRPTTTPRLFRRRVVLLGSAAEDKPQRGARCGRGEAAAPTTRMRRALFTVTSPPSQFIHDRRARTPCRHVSCANFLE
ncbi:hypothetical protein RR46_13923 [Papilio xuthus]|uniref:Uncharacterized protein n=1 Tax=Papilio xuthus TaxID=66420 RepID=A0A194PHB6_PAPXU|nr:hypothetical protein RR46_13923 [Papilio xuthus]